MQSKVFFSSNKCVQRTKHLTELLHVQVIGVPILTSKQILMKFKKKSYLLKTNYRFSFYSSISDIYGKIINLRVYNRFHDSDLVLPRLSSIISRQQYYYSIRCHHRLTAHTIHEYCEIKLTVVIRTSQKKKIKKITTSDSDNL